MYQECVPELEGIQLGVDEAGRGSFWGPLVAAAVILPPLDTLEESHPLRENVLLIKDSKKLTEKRRLKIYDIIIEYALGIGIGRVEAYEIDKHNAFWANSLGFRRAVDECIADFQKRQADFQKKDAETVNPISYNVILDGNLPLPDYRQEEHIVNVENGDATYMHIAAASIVAKVTHDKIVEDWCIAHPRESALYGLTSSKGYGTVVHRKALQTHGPLTDHRRSYLRKTLPEHALARICIMDDNDDI